MLNNWFYLLITKYLAGITFEGIDFVKEIRTFYIGQLV